MIKNTDQPTFVLSNDLENDLRVVVTLLQALDDNLASVSVDGELVTAAFGQGIADGAVLPEVWVCGTHLQQNKVITSRHLHNQTMN